MNLEVGARFELPPDLLWLEGWATGSILPGAVVLNREGVSSLEGRLVITAIVSNKEGVKGSFTMTMTHDQALLLAANLATTLRLALEGAKLHTEDAEGGGPGEGGT